jgi:hypothetical protein
MNDDTPLTDPSVLKGQEADVLAAASQLLDRPLPQTPADTQAYAYHNLRLQNAVNDLRMKVKWARHGRNTLKLQLENKLRRDARDDGVRDKEERETFCHKNPQWRELNDTVVQLSLTSDRLESVEWMLKSGMSFVEKRGG